MEWMIDCERCWTVLQNMQCNTLTNVLWFGECLCLRHRTHLYSWERITQTTCIPSKKTGKNPTLKQMFDISEKLMVEQSDEIFLTISNHLGKFSMETVISGQWWRSHQFLACKGLCILRFCVMSCKRESKPNIKYCLGTAVGLVQRFITIQNFGHNWRRTDGIRVKYCPRIHYIAVRPRSPKIHEQKGRTRTIPRTNYLHVDVQWHHMGNWRQWNGVYRKFHTCVCICKKISNRTLVIPRTWIRNEVVWDLQRKTRRKMGQGR